MNDCMFRHVLFKDLLNYLSKRDYLKGYTETELAYVRHNIGAVGKEDLEEEMSKILHGCVKCTYSDIQVLISNKELITGSIYAITDFQTIYQSNVKNLDNKYITWGLDVNPSPLYTLLLMAVSEDTFMPYATILDPELLLYDIKFDVTSITLDDGINTKGLIIYMSDTNLNLATFDFKSILLQYDNKLWHTFSDDFGNDNSNHCKGNNLSFSKNVIIKLSINNLLCSGVNIIIDSDIDLTDGTLKLIVHFNDKNYLDYLDIETLTHLFYALESYIC